MKKNDKYILFGAAGLAIFWFATKSRALAGLVFSPGPITNFYLTGAQPVAELQVMAQNTNSSSLEMNSFAGNVFCNGQYVGNVYNFQRVIIPANSQTAIPVAIQFQITGLVNELVRAFTTSDIKRVIDIDGSANVNGFQLPIKLSFSVGA